MISILNYGIGNVKAFANIFLRLNIPFKIVSNSKELNNSEKILFPGVGAFDNAMTLLNDSGMRDSLETLVMQKQIPILGVCVGMQMFANYSQEGIIKGLGWIDATVNRFEEKNNLSVPQMGWNNIEISKSNNLFNELSNNSHFYFLHSYYFKCLNDSNIAATSYYGSDFTSIVIKENIVGVQFHPEKSHSAGMTLLNNFAKSTIC